MNKIKYSFLTACTAILLAFSGCEQVSDSFKVDVDVSMAEAAFDIPATIEGGDVRVSTVKALDLDALIKNKTNNKFSISNIKSLKVTSCDLILENGDDANNFSALKSAKVELSSNTKPSEYAVIAEITSNSTAKSSNLSVPINNVDVVNYASGTVFTIRVSGLTQKTTTKTLHCKATVKYVAEVKP